MLTNVNYTITDGGLGRTAPSQDGVSAFIFLNDNITDLTSFSTTNRMIAFETLASVEATGITANSTNFKGEHYQISEFFRLNGGILYVSIFTEATSFSTGIDNVISFTNGNVRLFGVYSQEVLSGTEIGVLNAKMESLFGLKKPAHLIYGAQTGTLTFAEMPDLKELSATYPRVSVVFGQNTVGYPLSVVATESVQNVGAILGAVSSTDVATNIMIPGKFNYSSTGQMEIAGFVINDGLIDNTLIPVTNILVTEELLGTLNDKGYISFRFHANLAGTYLTNDNTCSIDTSDFYSIRNNRVIGKVLRETDAVLTPMLGSKTFSDGGKIRQSTIASFKNTIAAVLNIMVTDLEINAYTIYIDPNQNILADSTLDIELRIQPIGSADFINVDLGYTGVV